MKKLFIMILLIFGVGIVITTQFLISNNQLKEINANLKYVELSTNGDAISYKEKENGMITEYGATWNTKDVDYFLNYREVEETNTGESLGWMYYIHYQCKDLNSNCVQYHLESSKSYKSYAGDIWLGRDERIADEVFEFLINTQNK